MPKYGDIQVEVIVSDLFAENCLLVRQGKSRDCLIVDPGLDPEKIISTIERLGWQPVAILNTHGHADHIGGNRAIKARWPEIPLVIGVNEAHLLTDPVANLSGLTGMPITSPQADRCVIEGEILHYAGMELEIREIPGHSPGHVVYVLLKESPVVVLGGDVLFQGSIGRTDFPGGSMPLLFRGIQKKLLTLPDETVVYPGHGEATTIGEERRFNPFLRGKG